MGSREPGDVDMTDEIRIWAIDDSSKAVEQVQPTKWTETEGSLEGVLVRNPDMLMPGLKLVGRQTPTDSGSLDLLGVDEDGRLVVFELKREKLTRQAVAQAIDYCSYLESLTATDLATYIAKYSGTNGIDKIEDFEEWYDERFEERETELRPPKMVLVGLGADFVAQRMVGFLVENGVDISLLTFHGYECGGRTLLARQVERGEARDVGSSPRQKRAVGRRRGHAELAEKLGITDLWQDVVKKLSVAGGERVTGSGITFRMRRIGLDNVKHKLHGSHSVVIDEKSRKIRVTFYPISVHLCRDEFQQKRETIRFEFRKPPNAQSTNEVSEEWYCLLDKKEWETHKDVLTALAESVTAAWEAKLREAKV